MTKPINDELKPCPFCGGEAEKDTWVECNSCDSNCDTVSCSECGARVCRNIESNATELWMRRVPTGLECCGNCAKMFVYPDCPHVPQKYESVLDLPGPESYCRRWELAPGGWRREIEVE